MKKDLKLFEVPRIDSIQELIIRSEREFGPKLAL